MVTARDPANAVDLRVDEYILSYKFIISDFLNSVIKVFDLFKPLCPRHPCLSLYLS